MWASNANNQLFFKKKKQENNWVPCLHSKHFKKWNSWTLVQALHGQKKKKHIREKVETVTDFLFLGSKITVDSDSSDEIKRPFSYDEKLWEADTLF